MLVVFLSWAKKWHAETVCASLETRALVSYHGEHKGKLIHAGQLGFILLITAENADVSGRQEE
jgi:hypothetical protein